MSLSHTICTSMHAHKPHNNAAANYILNGRMTVMSLIKQYKNMAKVRNIRNLKAGYSRKTQTNPETTRACVSVANAHLTPFIMQQLTRLHILTKC